MPAPDLTAGLRLPFAWEPGEHMAVIGDTGSGKSTLMAALLRPPIRNYVLILRSKWDEIRYDAKRVSHALPGLLDPRIPRLELYPKRGAEQFREFSVALERAFRQKGWTVYVDELYHVDRLMGLRPQIEEHLTQGRSGKITVVTGVQRPVQVTRFAISQSKHVICFRQEGRDAKTVAEATSPDLGRVIAELGRYEFVWWERTGRGMWRGRLQELQAWTG